MRQLLLLILLLLAGTSYSQSAKVYLDKNLLRQPDKQKAEYYRTVQFDGDDKNVRVFSVFYISGEKYSEVTEARTPEGKYQKSGPARYFYKSGQLKEESNYKGDKVEVTKWYENGQLYYTYQQQNGKKEGEAVGYYPDGQIRRREFFVKGELKKGQCFAADGAETAYYPHTTPAEFPGGEKAMFGFINKNVSYPYEASEKRISGVVILKINIEKTGAISSVDILRSIDPHLDAAALKVVKAMPVFKPATEEGALVTFTDIIVPISFKLRN